MFRNLTFSDGNILSEMLIKTHKIYSIFLVEPHTSVQSNTKCMIKSFNYFNGTYKEGLIFGLDISIQD